MLYNNDVLAQLFQPINVTGLCNLDAGSTFISFDAAPSLLLYSYIPAIIIALILSFIIFNSNRKENLSKAFLVFTISYSLWVINIILQWVLVPNKLLFIAWQLTAFLEIGLYMSALYFLQSFSSREPVGNKTKILFMGLLSLVAILTPSLLNLTSYDYENCVAVIGPLWYVIYLFEILVPIVILIYGFIFAKKEKNLKRRREIILFSGALAIFLGFFSASNIGGELLQIYSFNLFGPIGMLIFIGFVTYLIVRYQAFNIKLISVQAFVWALLIIIGSEFFFIRETVNFILIGATFVAAVVSGVLLIRSVKKEIKQKEELAKLNVDLGKLIEQRESLVHLVTHKVKGSFTRSKYIFAGLLDGTFGEITPDIRKYAQQGLDSDNTGIQTVDLVLNASNLQKGAVKYDMKLLDFKDMVLKTITEKRVGAEAKGLTVETHIPEDTYNILGDAFWLKETVNNLIENSTKYTKKGTIIIALDKKDGKITLSVKDTGVGITAEDKKNLFREGGRGKDSVKINVDSTGYGLYTVKLVIEAHKGRVWVESEGEGKGSQFYMELDAVS